MTHRLPYLALATAGILWGTTVPLSKSAVEWAGPAWLTALRFALAAPLLACFARRGLRAAVAPGVVAWGAVGYGLVILLQNAGLAQTSATHGAILVGAMPAMVALLCSLLGRAPLRRAAGVGFGVALIGVALVAGGGNGGTDLAGDGLVLASVGVAAAFAIVQPRLLEGRDVVAVTAVQFAAAGFAGTVAAVLLEGTPAAPTTDTDVVALLALVVFGTLAPFTLFAFGQSQVAPQIAGAFVNLEPLVGAALGVVVLGDSFSPSQGVGCAAILTGIALSAWPSTARGAACGGGPESRPRDRGPRSPRSLNQVEPRVDGDVGAAFALHSSRVPATLGAVRQDGAQLLNRPGSLEAWFTLAEEFSESSFRILDTFELGSTRTSAEATSTSAATQVRKVSLRGCGSGR